tara:strand:+ start:892 stop:1782 length:891 start_codon:yes stop_codon:yes gene_type:complete
MLKINFYHTLIFFKLTICISAFEYIRNNDLLIFSLFLILCIGISHGSLDNLKGKKLLKYYNINSISIFYIAYILFSLIIILFWIFFPDYLLILFLILASYHFGKEDSDFLKNDKNQLFFLFKGSLIIAAPLLFNKSETIEIFKSLNFDISKTFLIDNNFLFLILVLSLISTLFLSSKKTFEIKSLLLMDYLSILILNFFINPILAFTIYFCFLHSIRHSLSLIFELDNNFNKGLNKFVKKAIPLTVLTAIIYLLSLFYLNKYYPADQAIYKVIFIGLASLTFPHILLEYLIEKNEK